MRSLTAEKILEDIRRISPYSLDIMGFHIQVDNNVYPPREESVFMAENLRKSEYGIRKNDRVLDYGCGSGFQSLVSASLGGIVVATDINSLAVECSRKNAMNNYLEDKIQFRIGKNLEPVLKKEYFDVVIASLPFEDAQPLDNLEYSLYDFKLQMRKALFENIRNHLTVNGRIFYTYSDRVQKIFPLEESGNEFNFKIIDERKFGEDVYYLFLIRPNSKR